MNLKVKRFYNLNNYITNLYEVIYTLQPKILKLLKNTLTIIHSMIFNYKENRKNC